MGVIDDAITATIEDMIRNSTECNCCGSAGDHADLIIRALKRTPVDWWPRTDVTPDFYQTNAFYRPIYSALETRILPD